MQSSTSTLTVRVCSCDREGKMKLCNAEALTARAGLSTGALVAILLCVIILLSEYEVVYSRRRHRRRSQLVEQNLDLASVRSPFLLRSPGVQTRPPLKHVQRVSITLQPARLTWSLGANALAADPAPWATNTAVWSLYLAFVCSIRAAIFSPSHLSSAVHQSNKDFFILKQETGSKIDTKMEQPWSPREP